VDLDALARSVEVGAGARLHRRNARVTIYKVARALCTPSMICTRVVSTRRCCPTNTN
jgi:hypothetical protein